MNLNLGDTKLLLAACEKRGYLRNQAAYLLATVYHETAATMKPIKEYGGLTYLKSKKYYPYFGRGYVQLTWEENYKWASDLLDVDMVKNPDLALVPEYATEIIVAGMLQGVFTKKKLSDYITLSKSDFKGARKIINGTDKDDLIADYAKAYDNDLLKIGYGVIETPPITNVPVEAPSKPVGEPKAIPNITQPETSKTSLWSILADLILSLFKVKK